MPFHSMTKEQRFNSLHYYINTGTSSYFILLLEKYGPFIDEFQMCDDQGKPLFETLILRIIDDSDFKITNMDWMKKISFNSEWAHDLLEVETDDKYYHNIHSKEHIEYMISILKMLKSK